MVQLPGALSVVDATTQAAELHKHAPDRREGAHSPQSGFARPASALSVNRALIICTAGGNEAVTGEATSRLTCTNRAGDRSRTRDILITRQPVRLYAPPQQPSHLRKRT